MIAATDQIVEKPGYLRSELRSLGVKPRDLNGEELADLMDFVKQEMCYNYKKAYPESK